MYFNVLTMKGEFKTK